jgi:dihydrofolate synthase/folylpolyglutamate synthase
MAKSERLLADLKLSHPTLIDLSLERIERLLAKLGRPQNRLPPVIHVAGTNGKGSTVAYLKAMLEAAGRRVHTYTSPHLIRFHERIVLAGSPVREADLVRVLGHVAQVNGGEPITFFEVTTAAALYAFAEVPADAVLLEVGLGGRLDATNVVPRPALTIITPVAMDHADKLGATLTEIAAEKAGILKPGVKAVVAHQNPSALDIVRHRAEAIGAPLAVWGDHFEAFEQRGRMVFQMEDVLLDLPRPALLGRHQIVNAGTAVAAALALAAPGLDERAIERGLLEVAWPGRMQRLKTGPLADLLRPGSELWLDGGHNPAGGEAIAQTLADLEERAPRPLHLIVGMLAHKDAAGFLAAFRGLARHVVTVDIPAVDAQAQRPEELAGTARNLGFSAQTADNVTDAIGAIEVGDAAPKRIMICGSLYLVGHVLALQEGVAQQGT